jgi:hypothetical protein
MTGQSWVGERGSALVIAVFALVLSTAMALALLATGRNELVMADAERRASKSFYMAEAAVEHARMALFAANKGGSFDDELDSASGGTLGNGVIDFDPTALAPSYDGFGTLTGFSAGVGDDVALVGLTAFADGMYAAYLTNDAVDSLSSTSDTNGRVMLTGIGATPDRSLEVVQVVVELDPILYSPPPAALTLLGPNPNYSPGSSASKIYRGDDCAAGTPGAFVSSVGVIGTTVRDYVRVNMGKPTYSGGGLMPEFTIADVSDPTEPTVTTPIDPMWADCVAVKKMIEELRQVADVICHSQSCSLPPASPERIVFVDADYSIGNGQGLIVVTGRATMGGSALFQGTVLVIGEGDMNRAGGSSVEGAVIVANVSGPDGSYGTADDCQNGYEVATWGTSGGGGSMLGYCSAYNVNPSDLYRVTQFLQR